MLAALPQTVPSVVDSYAIDSVCRVQLGLVVAGSASRKSNSTRTWTSCASSSTTCSAVGEVRSSRSTSTAAAAAAACSLKHEQVLVLTRDLVRSRQLLAGVLSAARCSNIDERNRCQRQQGRDLVQRGAAGDQLRLPLLPMFADNITTHLHDDGNYQPVQVAPPGELNYNSSFDNVKSDSIWTARNKNNKLLDRRPTTGRRTQLSSSRLLAAEHFHKYMPRCQAGHTVLCACSAAEPSGHSNSVQQQTHYVDCRHWRCFDDQSDSATRLHCLLQVVKSRSLDHLTRTPPPSAIGLVSDNELELMKEADGGQQSRLNSATRTHPPSRPTTAPSKLICDHDAVSTVLPCDYFNFVFSAKLHDQEVHTPPQLVYRDGQRRHVIALTRPLPPPHLRRTSTVTSSSRRRTRLTDVMSTTSRDEKSVEVGELNTFPRSWEEEEEMEELGGNEVSLGGERSHRISVEIKYKQASHEQQQEKAQQPTVNPRNVRVVSTIDQRLQLGAATNPNPVGKRHDKFYPQHFEADTLESVSRSLSSMSSTVEIGLNYNNGEISSDVEGMEAGLNTSATHRKRTSGRKKRRVSRVSPPSGAAGGSSRKRRKSSATARRRSCLHLSIVEQLKRDVEETQTALEELERDSAAGLQVETPEPGMTRTKRQPRPKKERKETPDVERRKRKEGVVELDEDQLEKLMAYHQPRILIEKTRSIRYRQNKHNFDDRFDFDYRLPTRRYSTSDVTQPQRPAVLRPPRRRCLSADPVLGGSGDSELDFDAEDEDVDLRSSDDDECEFQLLEDVDEQLTTTDDKVEEITEQRYYAVRKHCLRDEPNQTPHQRLLWASLQAEFERHIRHKADIRDVLAAVLTNDRDLVEFRNTLLRMEAFRLPEEPKEHDMKSDYVQRSKLQPWTFGRLALSQRACRLELPVDIKLLEKLSPQEYIRKYCKISVRRLALYKKIFSRYQEKSATIPFKDLYKALFDIFSNAVTEADVSRFCQLLLIDEDTKIDLSLFGATAAITERLLYPHFVTEHTKDIDDYKQVQIESADFYSLQWKLKGVDVNAPMHALILALQNSMQPGSVTSPNATPRPSVSWSPEYMME